MKMMIFLSLKGTILAGETIDLHHGVEGFDGYNIRYQWTYDKPGKNSFRNAEGVNEVSFQLHPLSEKHEREQTAASLPRMTANS